MVKQGEASGASAATGCGLPALKIMAGMEIGIMSVLNGNKNANNCIGPTAVLLPILDPLVSPAMFTQSATTNRTRAIRVRHTSSPVLRLAAGFRVGLLSC